MGYIFELSATLRVPWERAARLAHHRRSAAAAAPTTAAAAAAHQPSSSFSADCLCLLACLRLMIGREMHNCAHYARHVIFARAAT